MHFNVKQHNKSIFTLFCFPTGDYVFLIKVQIFRQVTVNAKFKISKRNRYIYSATIRKH